MKDIWALMETQNDSGRSRKFFNPRNSSLLFDDTLGSSPVHLSNAGRNILSLRKRNENSKKMDDKSIQTDPTPDVFPPLFFEQLEKQTNFLIENLGTILKSLEPDFQQNLGNTTMYQNEYNEISSAGDVDSNIMKSPAFWTKPIYRTSLEVEHTETNKTKNRFDSLKEKLKQVLDCAFKIKNIIPMKLQHQSSGIPDTLHMPTGAIITPGTQTEPVNTYIKFLQVNDKTAGFPLETVDGSRNRFTRSPRRMKLANKTHTVDSTGRHQKYNVKWETTNADRRSSNNSFDNVLNETLNRKTDPCSSLNRKKGRKSSSRRKNNPSSSQNRRVHPRPPSLNRKNGDLDLDVTIAEITSDHTVGDWSGERLPKTYEKPQPYEILQNQRYDKITKMPSGDAILSTQPVEKQFILKDYISALKQVSNRSPSTKKIREFATRSKAYFDFDDYYEKLISMNNKHKLITDSINNYYS